MVAEHLVAHVMSNADALGNLVDWASTGVVTPMYNSPEERAADIERGARLGEAELVGGLHRSVERLGNSLDALNPEQWSAEVVTAQGRTVPATEIPWLRAREVLVHAVDLDLRVGFDDLPADFLTALCDDIAIKRATTSSDAVRLVSSDTRDTWAIGSADVPNREVIAPLAELTAYLAGRPHTARLADGSSAPALSPWL